MFVFLKKKNNNIMALSNISLTSAEYNFSDQSQVVFTATGRKSEFNNREVFTCEITTQCADLDFFEKSEISDLPSAHTALFRLKRFVKKNRDK